MINKMYAMLQYIPDEAKERYIETNSFGLDLTNRKEDVIVIDFTVNEDESIELTGSEVVQYSKRNNLRWFYYAAAKARANPKVPTVLTDLSKFSELVEVSEETDSLFTDNEWKPGRNALKFMGGLKNSAINPVLTNLESYIENNFSLLATEINKNIDNTKAGLNLLTIRLKNKFIGESDYFEKVLEEWEENYYEKYYVDKKQQGDNQVCSICHQVKENLWGYVSTFNFYAAKTELAPISGGFDKKQAYKNYPVCPKCAKQLDQAKYLLTNHMSYRFCGFNYFIIPEFILPTSDNEGVMEFFYDESKIGQFRLKHGSEPIISNDQVEILDILAKTENSLNYSLIFWEGSQAKFSLLLNIDGVYPSQFQEIYQAKRKADQFSIFKSLKGLYEKGEHADLKFMFDNLKVFLPIKSKIYGDYSKSFLELVGSIFRQEKISYKMMIERFMSIYSRKWSNEVYQMYDIEKMINIIYFLHYLKLIDLGTKKKTEVVMEEVYADFLTEYEEFLNSDAKRAIFLMGVLTQKLLNIQYQERKATPFRKQLNSLKLSPAHIQRLLPQIIEKLEQYSKNYYRNLESLIAELLLTAKLNELSNDEISFYFTTGMTLEKKFRTQDKINEED